MRSLLVVPLRTQVAKTARHNYSDFSSHVSYLRVLNGADKVYRLSYFCARFFHPSSIRASRTDEYQLISKIYFCTRASYWPDRTIPMVYKGLDPRSTLN